MKKLNKLPPPSSIISNGATWTERYANEEPRKRSKPWLRPEIKEILLEETEGKCAYCQAEFINVSFGEIEHIKPKSKFPELVVDWPNLTVCCSRCNNKKGSKYFDDVPFLNPFIDEIGEHLLFLGAFIQSTTHRGDLTVKEIELNGAERIEARFKHINNLENLIRNYEREEPGTIKQLNRQLIIKILHSGEFSAFTRSFLKCRAPELLDEGLR